VTTPERNGTTPLARPPLVLMPAEWDSVRVAIETGADHPLDSLLDVCTVRVDVCSLGKPECLCRCGRDAIGSDDEGRWACGRHIGATS
jgi:hypothetical protein